MLKFLGRVLGESNQRAVDKLMPIVEVVNSLESRTKALSDGELAARTDELRGRLDAGEGLDDILPEAFAAVREAAHRRLSQRHFDVQVLGGIILHQGRIAEMKTGEGKTLVATLPAYLNALQGRGVHVVTVNDYLAKRDASWMGPVYQALGISVGCLQADASFIFDPDWAAAEEEKSGKPRVAPDGKPDPMRSATKQEAYRAGITYGTNNEFGFDYLRDNMVDEVSRMVQGGPYYAIVDEVDNILIDEARTPLIISGPARESGQEYRKYAAVAERLEKEADFTVDEKQRTISLSEEGIAKAEKQLGVENLYAPEHYGLTHLVENAVRAAALYQRDREYVVREGEVIIVDEFTGRLMNGRRWSDGLHQAVEAKEKVRVRRESITYATITLQNYFRLYEKLAGMTGTAATEAEELHKIYKLDVVQIPTNSTMIRKDLADLIYMTEEGKYRAVANEVEELHATGRPVLIGTVSIEKSELLSDLLKARGIPHEVLNAKNHEREAMIIAQAGHTGSVTVATNMAGRGTDIILGGSPDPSGDGADEWQREHDRVIELGGLYIMGTERHEARRIDNQLRGRAGRQGDPGESQFFVSTEDDLMRRFGGDRIKGVMSFVGLDEDTPIENRMVSKAVEGAQSRVEGTHFEIRKHLVDYDDVVNTHRSVIYKLRRKVLGGWELRETILDMVQKEIAAIAALRLIGDPMNWDIEGLQRDVGLILTVPKDLAEPEDVTAHTEEEVRAVLEDEAGRLYDERENQFGPEAMRLLERAVMLRTIDSQWVEHLTAMENMRQGIGLEAAGQRDPLVQYKRMAYEMFSGLVERIDHDIVRTIFRVAITQPAGSAPAPARAEGRGAVRSSAATTGAGRDGTAARVAAMAGQGTAVTAVAGRHGSDVAAGQRKVGRNEPCPCGGGKKYKRCHGAT